MVKFDNVKLENYEGFWNFECYKNTEPINIGDVFIFTFAGTICIDICQSKEEQYEINQNDRVRNEKIAIDLVTGFWKNCYKIKTTNFDLTQLD